MADRVLVVDDEPLMLQTMVTLLNRGGFDSTPAESAEEALRLVAANEFDAALVDKNLGGMDGIELISHLRKRQPRCACIIMTAAPSTGSAIEALRLGAADYLEKPSPELDRVAERVRQAIGGARLRGASEALASQVTALQAELKRRDAQKARERFESSMTAELLEARAAEKTEEARRIIRERDERLAESTEKILAQLRVRPGMEKLAAEVQAQLEALRAG
jgi:DNA-binding response OmpR family regulator